MKQRAKFYKKIIPILESMPAKRFTKKGWKKTSDLIPLEW